MKLNLAKCKSREESTETAFTLIEMIGVLAVIAILAALLIPKVFDAISSARVNSAAVSIETLKTAITDHYGKYGLLNTIGGTNPIPVPTNNYDIVMMTEGLLDKPFSVKLGSGSTVLLTSNAACCGGFGYMFDTNSQSGTFSQSLVAEAIISNVVLQDAVDLNNLIDGTNLSGTRASAAALIDGFGRVEYQSAAEGTVTVYVYLTGR